MINVSESASLGLRSHKSGQLCQGRQLDSMSGGSSVRLRQRDNPTVSEWELQNKSHDSHQGQSQPTKLLPSCFHIVTFTQSWVLCLHCHISGIWQRQSGLWRKRGMRCSYHEGNESWIINKLPGFFVWFGFVFICLFYCCCYWGVF